MFSVIYQHYIKKGQESNYKQLWQTIMKHFTQEKRLAKAATLDKGSDGLWVSYERWNDKASHDKSWSKSTPASKDLPPEIQKAINDIKECVDSSRSVPTIVMEPVDNIWQQ